MEHYQAILALCILIIAIVVSFVKNINIGVISMAFALLAMILFDIPISKLISGFPSNSFITLFGTMFLFGIAVNNGTMHMMASVLIRMAGKEAKLLPIIMMYFAMFICAIGAGPAPAVAIAAAPAVAVAIELEESPFTFGTMVWIGAMGGAASPISTAGIVTNGLCQDMGVTGIFPSYTILPILAFSILGFGTYFILKGYKIQFRELSISSKEKLNRNQIITLLGILGFVLAVVIFRIHVGLTALMAASILLLFKVAEEKVVFKNLAWGILIMFTGVNVLMNVVVLTGGIGLIVSGLSRLMTPHLANPIMTLFAGLMSIFATTTSVVLPTLVPTVPGIVDAVGGVTMNSMLSALNAGSFSSSISPISGGGGTLYASICQITQCDEKQQMVYYKKQFFASPIFMIAMTILSAVGFFNIIP